MHKYKITALNAAPHRRRDLLELADATPAHVLIVFAPDAETALQLAEQARGFKAWTTFAMRVESVRVEERRPMHYDREGLPIEAEMWMLLFEDHDYKRVETSDIGEVRVSTVWLGIDHNFSKTGQPLIFETMVFGGELDHDCARYTTEAEARAGHVAIVQRVRETLS